MVSSSALIRRALTYRWVCLGLLFFSGLLAFFTRLAPAVAIPDLRAAFDLYATARKIKAARLRQLHPDWTEEEVQRRVKEIFLHAAT